MRILILILICFNINASQWIPSDSVGIEQLGNFSILPSMERCEKVNKRSCEEIIGRYNYRTFVRADQMVDDSTKPIYDKIDMSTCSDISDCDTRHLALVCSGYGYEKIKNYDLLQVYCIKVVGYEKKPSGKKIVIEDSAKKSLNDAAILASENSKKAYRDSLISIRSDIEAGKNLTPSQINEVLNYILKSL